MADFDYTPIDYVHWDLSGKGNNIMSSLSAGEREIWEKAISFQDKRDDAGHVEVVTYFALKLTDLLKGNRDITIPAAILHDTGWSQMTKEEHALFYADEPVFKRYEPTLRARHQEQGVLMARKILTDISYPVQESEKITEIVSEHDTRKGFISLEDGIVRDADKLWRFTMPELGIFMGKRGFSPEKHYDRRAKNIDAPGFFYSDTSKEMARIELDNAHEFYETMIKR